VITFSLGAKDGKVSAENLTVVSTTQLAPVRKQREQPNERSPSETTDADAEFERDWV
jgi:hypothetical protein